MKNKERVYVGDIVITTKDFLPRDRNEERVNLFGRKLKGIMVIRRGEYYGVRFGKGLSFTDHLNGLLSNPTGYMLKRNEFEIVEE